MPSMQIDSIRCLDPSDRRRDEVYYLWAYRYGREGNVFVGSYRPENRSQRNFKRGDSARLDRPIVDDWGGIQNGALALMEEQAVEDFSGRTNLRRKRRRELEHYINRQCERAGPINSSELQRFLADGIRNAKVNDELIGTCPLEAGTFPIAGAGGRYEVTLETV